MFENKKNAAVFTIVRDESFYLPLWLRHYKRHFSNDDIYVMNNQSIDGSCDGLDVNLVEVLNEEAFSHNWLISQVQSMQSELLERYEVVVFAEVDELIYCLGDLNEEIEKFKNSEYMYTNVHSMELVHNMAVEDKFQDGRTITGQRDYWCHFGLNDKPLITKTPLRYGPGFHRCDKPVQFFGEFFMLHLHRFDFEIMLERHKFRKSRWKFADDGELGWHNKISDDEGVKKLLLTDPATGRHHELVRIPENHKEALKHI